MFQAFGVLISMDSDAQDVNKKRILIQRIEELPTLPTTLSKIISVAENPDSGARDLAIVISQDQSISSMVLRLVNSAFYGHFRNISSISHAIVILGFQTVKNLALGTSIFRAQPSGSRPVFNRNKFWAHSLAVGTFTKRLAPMVKGADKIDPETAFVTGLLHDLGKVIFDNYFNEEYRQASDQARERKEWIRVAEEETLGMSHTLAGRMLAEKWHFPANVVSAIGFHHDPEKAGADSGVLSPLVHVANHCCHELKIGSGGNFRESVMDDLAMRTLGVSRAALDEVSAAIENDRQMIEAFSII